MYHFGLSLFISCSILVAFAVGDTGLSGNWTGFRGPAGQGHAEHVNPPLTWSQTENIAWKTAIPREGWSSPIVYEGSVYFTTARLDGGNPTSLRLVRVDAESGTIVWDKEALPWSGPSPKIGTNSHASPTPLAEDDRIYVHFGHMGTACLDTDGNVLWQQQELRYGPRHGNGGSPVLVGDELIFSADGSPDPFVVAISKETGEVVWKTLRNAKPRDVHSFSTPCVVTLDGQTQIVSPGSGIVGAYDAKDGKEIWRLNYGGGYSVVPCPVVGQGKVFVSSGFGDSRLYAIRLGGSGDVTDSHVAWRAREDTPNVVSPLYVEGILYMLAENGWLSCFDAATGTLHWKEKLDGQFYASPVYAKGRIYMLDQRGTTWVLKPGVTFELLAENSLGEQAFATPAFSENAVFIRTRDHLYRIEE